MAVGTNQSEDLDSDGDRELSNDAVDELSNGQAEAILSREIDVREAIDDVLRDLEADVRRDPPRLDDGRLEELDGAIGDLIEFSRDLHELEPKGGDDDGGF